MARQRLRPNRFAARRVGALAWRLWRRRGRGGACRRFRLQRPGSCPGLVRPECGLARHPRHRGVRRQHRFHAGHRHAARHPAAGQRAAGREVRREARAGGARTVRPPARGGERRPRRRPRDRDSVAAERARSGLVANLARALSRARAGRDLRHAARRRSGWLHQFGRRHFRGLGGPARRLLPLRQAPPGAVRRVHSDRISLVHAADEHSARRLQPRPGHGAVVRRQGRARGTEHLLRRPVRRRARGSIRAGGERPDDPGQHQQHRLVRRDERGAAAPADLAHAHARAAARR